MDLEIPDGMNVLEWLDQQQQEINAMLRESELQTREFLRELVTEPGSHETIAQFLQSSDVPIELIQYFLGPVFLFQQVSGNGHLPRWAFKACWLMRFDQIMTEIDQKTVGIYATPAEVFLFVYTIGLIEKVSGELFEVLVWCAYEIKKHYGTIDKDSERFFHNIPEDSRVEFEKIEDTYRKLARLCRRYTVNAAKSPIEGASMFLSMAELELFPWFFRGDYFLCDPPFYGFSAPQ